MNLFDYLRKDTLDLFYVLFPGITAGLIAGVYMNIDKLKKIFTNMAIVPMVIIFTLMTILLQKMTWDMESLHLTAHRNSEKLMEEKWEILDDYFKSAMAESFDLSESLAKATIEDLSKYSGDEIDRYLEKIGLEMNNPIQKAVGDNIKGVYFRGIESDTNDPFAMLIGKGESDSFLFADFSENCAVDELTRNLDKEYELQSKNGDGELAKHAFNQLIGLKKGYPIEETIFFRFEGKDKGVPLTEYSYDAIRKSFFENKGDHRATFQSLEFLAPYYIFRDKSLGGSPRIIDRVKTNAKVIVIVSVFNFEEVINNDPYMVMTMERYDDLLRYLDKEMIREERTILITGILVMIIAFVLFILFWTYLHFNLTIKPKGVCDN